MAKKKIENMKLEQQELTPITIGVSESHKKSSFTIFIVMSLFVVAIIFLPEISNFVNKYFSQTPISPGTPINPLPSVDPKEEEDKEDDTKLYPFSEELKIERKDITLSSFRLDENTNKIIYTITNNATTSQNIEELNYFLEIYDENRTLLERVKLTKELSLVSGSFKEVESSINKNSLSNIGYVVLVKKKTSDYPTVEINTNEEKIGTLVCTNDVEKVTYKFNSNQLKEVTHEISYENTLEDYESFYTSVKNSSNVYNNKVGINSTFFEYATGFNNTIIMNLEEATRTYLFNADSFKLNEEPKVVKFEMEAQNFTCN